jgi:ArsR family transcriptional regulator
MAVKSFAYKEDHIQLAKFAKALAHPARLHILHFLEQQEVCITGSIVNELPIAQSSVSQHLKALKEAGLIHGTIEPPKVYYCINQENWKKAKRLFENFF